DLFGKQGACYGCWCTHFRLAPAVRRANDKQRNKDHIKARIEAGPPPGLLAFEDGKAVGWMQIGPRADVPEWNSPIDLSRDSRSIGLFVGSSRVFEKAGFERLVERKPGRPLMRLVLLQGD
ncbi:MAG: GNAT family N-acetyltransferase, partial [Mesorhizobium sp.]